MECDRIVHNSGHVYEFTCTVHEKQLPDNVCDTFLKYLNLLVFEIIPLKLM